MKILEVILTICFLAVMAPAQAETWPDKPIHWIVPYPAGGGTDLISRVLAAQLEKSLGQPVIVENRPGGSTVTATVALSKARPDGYTFGMVFDSLAINAALGVKTPYDPEHDFDPVIKLADVPLVLVVNSKQVPMKTLAEVIAYSKSHPNWFTFGSLGPGSPHEIGFKWFQSMSDMKALTVPYRGVAPALTDVVGGQVKGMFLGVAVGGAYIKDGTLHTLGVTSPKRLANAPNIPTIAEQGFPEYEFVTFYGLAAPRGTPQNIIERMNKEINIALRQPEVQSKLVPLGAILVGGTAKEFGDFLAANFKKFKKIQALSGATAK